MRKIVISLLVLFGVTPSIVLGQENADPFRSLLHQMQPANTELAYDSLLHNSKDSTLLAAFYRQKIAYPGWIGKLFLKTDDGSFREITIDTLSNEGGQPRIESFFAENIDQDKSPEFFLLVSWPVRHATVHGALYDMYVYDQLDSKNHLTPLREISDKFEGGCDCRWRDGRTNQVPIKSKKSIRSKLEELGLLNN